MANPSYSCQQLFRSERLQEGQELVWCSKRFRRDVAAEVRAVEMDFLHGGVGGGLRSFQILAQRRHAEHATAVRDNLIFFYGGSRVENFYAR